MERETWKEVIQLGDQEEPQVLPPSLSTFFFFFSLSFTHNTTHPLLKPISMVAFSPNGLYLAASDLAGSLFVWQFPSGTLVHK